MIPGPLVIACHEAADLAPLEWTVEGGARDVQAVIDAVVAFPGGELVELSQAGRDAVARLRLPGSLTYGDFMGLMDLQAKRRLRTTTPMPVSQRCAASADGGSETSGGEAQRQVR